MARHRIHTFTSIGRPLDPAYPTNMAVLIVAPLAGIVAGALAGFRGAGIADAAVAGLVGIAVAFGSWALARELAPDDEAAAFVSMVFAYTTFLLFGTPSLLLLFCCLFLVRVVNRTVGLPARVSDSIFVAAFTVGTMCATRSPLLGAVAALAFALDATLREPLRRQWTFAALCLAGAGLWVAAFGTGWPARTAPAGSQMLPIGIASVVFLLSYRRTRHVQSAGDATGAVLSSARVRAGMLIGLLVPSQALAIGTTGPELGSAVWATLAGVGIAGLRMKPRLRAGRS
ncbi:MAG: hypothetical protein PVG79_05960 [Gemmatimonadales bacterium]|jgi:hypothetical protein